jgi:hypothetical protein
LTRLVASGCAVALVVAAAGCGGGKKTATSTAAPDPGREAARALVAAVREHSPQALWGLLSTRARRRLGPTPAAFRRLAWPQLQAQLRYYASHRYKLLVSERIVGPFGVVAIVSGCCQAYAFPMRRQGTLWKAEPAGGRLGIDILGPQPGSSGHVQQVAFEARGAGGGATAVIYLDGVTLLSKEYPGTKSSTVFANLQSPLVRGHHNAVAFAAVGSSVAAKAWSFVAR